MMQWDYRDIVTNKGNLEKLSNWQGTSKLPPDLFCEYRQEYGSAIVQREHTKND
jgi:hypothetical protein